MNVEVNCLNLTYCCILRFYLTDTEPDRKNWAGLPTQFRTIAVGRAEKECRLRGASD